MILKKTRNIVSSNVHLVACVGSGEFGDVFLASITFGENEVSVF